MSSPTPNSSPAQLLRLADLEWSARRTLRVNRLVVGSIALLALAVLLFQSLWHGHVLAVDEYDDGVYFGASIELLHGIMPYRDFAFIQPPMISVFLLPFALMAEWSGTAAALVTARFFVDAIAVTNVVLVGSLVRRRSTLQVLAVTGIMAFYQGTIRSSQTVLIEPFLVLLCLVAIRFLMEGESVTISPRRVWLSGVFFGVAGATKLWAIFPLVAALITVWPAGTMWRRRLVAGSLIGFAVCSFPFLVTAPSELFDQVLITQAIRNGGGYPLAQRLLDLTGFPGFASLAIHGMFLLLLPLAGAALTAIFVWVNWWFRRGRPWPPLDKLALASWLVICASLVVSPTYYYHYSGFVAPFAALVIGSTLALVWEPLLRLCAVRTRFVPALVAVVCVPLSVGALMVANIDAIADAAPAPRVADNTSDAIPSAGCVLYANPTVALLDNRFTSDVSGCPDVIDVLGQERVSDDGLAATTSDSRSRALQADVLRWMRSSDAIVLSATPLGWSRTAYRYIGSYFVRMSAVPHGAQVYVRRRSARRA